MAKQLALPPELLTRGVEDILIREHLEKRLRSGETLRIKHGVDPTTSTLHIGYGVVYWKLRQFQELGHTIVFLIGDFTARFGDPTDKLESRHMRSKAEVHEAAAAYLDQIKDILDLSKTEIRTNGEWYDKMSAEELIRLLSQFSVAQLLERDMFVERQRTGAGIGLHEPIYPVLQGYDSVELKSDLTVVGSDQLFNELMARPLQERAGQQSQDIMTMSLLVGTDGKRKMSQSLHNEIGLRENPTDQFGKIMRIPDEVIFHYFELATQLPNTELDSLRALVDHGELSPRDAKIRLATEVVKLYHGSAAATAAAQEFARVFSQGGQPTEMPEMDFSHSERMVRIDELLRDAKLATSRSDAQRLIRAGAVTINERKVLDWDSTIELADENTLHVGRKWVKIFWKKN